MKYRPITMSRYSEDEIREAVEEKRAAGYDIIREPFPLFYEGKAYRERGFKRRSFYENIAECKWMAVVRKVD